MRNHEGRITSVDRALVLLQMLRAKGRLGVSAAAQELDVAPSTAYRLLSTLVARGFAVQGPGRQYYAGPEAGLTTDWLDQLHIVQRVRPHLETLHAATRETVHLAVRSGPDVRLVDGLESPQALKVGLRVGAQMPGHASASGKAMYAYLPWVEVVALHDGHLMEWPLARIKDLQALEEELVVVRERGYAVNHGETEAGVYVLGASMQAADGRPIAAMTVAVPADRLTEAPTALAEVLLEVRAACERDLRYGTASSP